MRITLLHIFLFFLFTCDAQYKYDSVIYRDYDLGTGIYYDNYDSVNQIVPQDLFSTKWKWQYKKYNSFFWEFRVCPSPYINTLTKVPPNSKLYNFICSQRLINGWKEQQLMPDSLYTKDGGWMSFRDHKQTNLIATEKYIETKPDIYLVDKINLSDHFYSVLVQIETSEDDFGGRSENVYLLNYTKDRKVLSCVKVAWVLEAEDSEFEFVGVLNTFNSNDIVVYAKGEQRPAIVVYRLKLDRNGKMEKLE